MGPSTVKGGWIWMMGAGLYHPGVGPGRATYQQSERNIPGQPRKTALLVSARAQAISSSPAKPCPDAARADDGPGTLDLRAAPRRGRATPGKNPRGSWV